MSIDVSGVSASTDGQNFGNGKRVRIPKCMPHHPEEVQWAKRKKGQAVEERCGECWKLVNRGFPGKSWEELLLRSQTSASFGKEYEEALRVMQSGVRSFIAEEFASTVRQEVVAEREYIVLSETDFRKRFAKSPQEAGVAMEEVQCESGEKVKGVLVLNPDMPHRRIRVRCVTGTVLEQKLQSPAEHYRPGQTHELKEWYERDLGKTLPVRLRRPMTLEELSAKMAEKPTEAVNEAAADQKQATSEEQAPQPEKESDSESEMAVVAAVALPSGAHASSKKPADKKVNKQKQRGKDKADTGEIRRRVASKRAVGDGSVTGSVAATDAKKPRSSAATARSGASQIGLGATSPRGQLEHDLRECLEKLNLHDILSGQPCRQGVYNANRKIEQAQKVERDSAETVNLKAHLQLVDSAELLSLKKIGTLSSAERQEKLEELMPHIDSPEDLPGAWQACIFTHRVKEMVLKTDSDLDAFCNCICSRHAGTMSCHQHMEDQSEESSRSPATNFSRKFLKALKHKVNRVQTNSPSALFWASSQTGTDLSKKWKIMIQVVFVVPSSQVSLWGSVCVCVSATLASLSVLPSVSVAGGRDVVCASPCLPGSNAFEWKAPMLHSLSLNEAEKGQLLLQTVVSYTLVPLMATAPKSLVGQLCSKIIATLSKDEKSAFAEIYKCAVTEVLDVCRYLLQLTDPSVSEDLSVINKISAAKNGVKLTVKRAVRQCPAYLQRETSLRETEVSRKLLLPQIDATMEMLSEASATWDVVGQAIHDLPRWEDRLPQGFA